MDSMPRIQVTDLSVNFGCYQALREINFSASAGEFILLTGPSGSGKSTLLRCLNGLVPQIVPARTTGQVMVAGLNTKQHPVATLAQKVGFVFQNPESQLFNLTVWDELLFGPFNAGISVERAEELAQWALEATGIAHLKQRQLVTLSGGEKQRVAIASVLALRPSILILDEPTAHLDVPGAEAVLSTVTNLCRNEGITVVLGEHRTGAVGRLADRLLVLDQGQMLADGPIRTVFAQQDLVYRLGIRRPADEQEQPWEHLIGEPPPLTGAPALAEMRAVEFSYGPAPILRGMDMAVYPGEVVALVGDNGAGKTTVARLLAGLLKPKHGQVLINGHKPRLASGDVGLVLQNPLTQLFCDTVEEEVSFGPSNTGCLRQAEIDEVLNHIDLAALRKHVVHGLSCGQQQRTVVASALALKPRLLILDEPTMGQDWGHLASMMNYLRCLANEGHGILLVTHDYKLVHRYADRLILLREGYVKAQGRLRHRERAEEVLVETRLTDTLTQANEYSVKEVVGK